MSGQPGLRQRAALHAQPGPPGEPVPVPLPQPRLLHGPSLQQPALHPALPGGSPLPPPDHQQHLHGPQQLLPLPLLHGRPHQRPGVKDGDGRGLQPPPQRRGALLLGQRGWSELLVAIRDQEGLLTAGGSPSLTRWRSHRLLNTEQALDRTEKTQTSVKV